MMLEQEHIISQAEEKVKCGVGGCHEDIFRDVLCLFHFIEVETAAWDDEDAERKMVLESVRYVFSDPILEGIDYIFGDPVGEVCR